MGSSHYEIRIKGRLSEPLLAAFKNFDAEIEPAETVLLGTVNDQAALHGLLEQIQSLGLELLEVKQLSRRRNQIDSA